MVYFLGAREPGEIAYGYEVLDGNVDKNEMIDTTPDVGLWKTSPAVQGRRINGEHMPKRIRARGPRRKLPDIIRVHGILVVDVRVRGLIETTEPEIHQFFPVDMVWKDGTLAAQRFWLVVGNRIDSIHRGLTTAILDKERRPQNSPRSDGGVIVYSQEATAGKHVWYDKHTVNGPFCSDALAEKLLDIRVYGIYLKELKSA